jgi:arginine decarboxylase
VADVQVINAGVGELMRVYVEMVRLGAGLKYVDVGGGLGVDYDGSQTNFDFSANYSLGEYASTVVYRVMSVCDEAGVEHPTIVTEAGRAMVSYQSVLVFDVLSTQQLDRYGIPEDLSLARTGEPAAVRTIEELLEAYHNVAPNRLLQCYHDAEQARNEALTLFNVGHLGLEHRGLVDRLFWATCLKIRDVMRRLKSVPEELVDLPARLSDTYFCNFSIFQSIPDAWAIDQLFPIMPIHRLREKPTRRATLADLTCDSDGRIARFVDRHDVEQTLPLHEPKPDERYYLAAFLVGAYQETLGDLHNLFGDTHVVFIGHDEQGQWSIEHVVEGDSVQEVLGYLQYDVEKLYRDLRRNCEQSVRAGDMTVAQSRALLESYRQGLSGYTYLE